MNILLIFIASVYLIFALTMITNLWLFPKLKQHNFGGELPSVSVLIPARNEEKGIATSIDKLLKINYPNFEIIVLDDNSEDETGNILSRLTLENANLQLIQGKPLPAGWMGKSWACSQLAEVAQGEILLFTDADVQWESDSLTSLINEMQRSRVDMLTVWASQITETLPERLTVPLMALVILGYLPVIMVHHSPFSLFAAANGQAMAWKRETYFALGGHSIVANNVLDDVTMARVAKQAGYKIRMVDGNGFVKTRMYDNWQSVRNGFAKNILAGYGNSVAVLILATILHWTVYLAPFALLFFAEYRVMASVLILAGITLRAVSAVFTRQRLRDALLMPISVLLMTAIAFQSIYWHFTGTSSWKGRQLAQKEAQAWQKVL